MDAMGAMIGPIFAFAILSAIVNGFHVVFVVSLCTAVIGVAVLGFFVENREEAGSASADLRLAIGARNLFGDPGSGTSPSRRYCSRSRRSAMPSST